ncbi:Pfs, NACHT, and ankyrin domain-containingprotein [Purpureocillium lilacinum]|uniref:Pfs, NACHT, and ankyrin domain-containingprotein n=1 Tax=Purpureocillium lilacinum TaxID=33203 RepID=A0A179FJW7_PURLI|nr:Pfs, NACHT, and ankyrin domain-containingprotein [Purpureocillium lilacinum]
MTLNNASEIRASGNAKVQIGTRLMFQVLDSQIVMGQNIIALERPGTPNDSDLLGDLYVTDPSNDLQFLKRRKRSRVDGTCEWILTTPQLVNWLNSPRNSSIETTSRILWIQGNPGQGKTTLAMYITEALTKSFSADASRSLGYFFCDTSYANRANANAILRGLLWQFYTSNPELIPAYARQRYGQLKEKLFRDFDSLWTLFLETARANSTRQLFCIIDALDECGDESRDDLLDQLEQTFETSDGPPNIHFLLLSRPYVHIRDLLGQFKSLDLASLPQIKEDVQQYIEYELEKLAKKKRYSTALKEKVKTVLVEKAEDTFLWVGGEILSTILKARRDEIVMTPRLLQSAAAHFTPGNMLSLITHPNFKVTASTLRSTMVNVHHGHEILALLGDRPEIREFFDQSLLEIAITDSSKDMVTYLLDRLGNTLIVTATMIIQASTNWKFGLEIAEMLLDRFPNDIHITDDIILSIMDVNSGDSTDSSKVHDVLQLLFKRVGPEFRVTERLLLGAARSEFEEGDEAVVFRLVLSRFSDTLPIPDDVIMAAAKNSNAWAAMPLLLRRRNPEIRITEEIFNEHENGAQIMWLLLQESMNADEVGTEILEEVLQGDKWGIMSVILKRRGATIRLSKDLVQGWISSERTPGKALKFLLQYKTAELDSILDTMSTDEQADFVERWDRLFERFARDSWDDIFKRRGK